MKLKYIFANSQIYIEMRRDLHSWASWHEWTTEPVTTAKMNLEKAPEAVNKEARGKSFLEENDGRKKEVNVGFKSENGGVREWNRWNNKRLVSARK